MTEKQIIASEKELQNYFRLHPRLNLEFKALMSRLLREHRIDVTPETLSRLTVSLDRSGADKEIDNTAIFSFNHQEGPGKAPNTTGSEMKDPIDDLPTDMFVEDKDWESDLDPGDELEPGGVKK